MSFEKGNKLGGRTRGSSNKSTEVIKRSVSMILENRESEEEKNESYIQKLMEIPEENFKKYHEGD